MIDGLIAAFDRMLKSDLHPVIIATAISFGFVFIHPFEDGNGRIHRFLIHYILSKLGFTPEGIIFPVSAVMLAEPSQYDACLESFSKPLLKIIDYDLNEDGKLTVNNNTINYYRYFDATFMVEYLYEVISKVIDFELVHELEFILNYDAAKSRISKRSLIKI